MATSTRFKYQIGKALIEGNGNDKDLKRLVWLNTVMYWTIRLIMAAGSLMISYKVYKKAGEKTEKIFMQRKPPPGKSFTFTPGRH